MFPFLLDRFLIASLALLSLASAQVAIAPTGRGTFDDPYRIASVENLHWLSTTPGAWDKAFVQAADIDASATSTWDGGAGFTPIGNEFFLFQGTYNGRGHKIAGLVIRRDSMQYVGLFARIGQKARLDSLVLVDDTIQGKTFCGALAGANSGLISSSSATGLVRCGGSGGGLVGYNDSYSTAIATANRIRRCHAGGTVIGGGWVGGLVGYNLNSIWGCSASARVVGTEAVGGLVGHNAGSIAHSHATGDVIATKRQAGGLVGYNFKGTMEACYASGAVAGDSDKVGGLIGEHNQGVASASYATGAVTGRSKRIGGLVGDNFVSRVTSSYATGKLSGPGLDYESRPGGLFGHDYQGTFDACYWDVEETGVDQASFFTIGGTYRVAGVTTDQMRTKSTFSGWDFAGRWDIAEGSGAPTLREADEPQIIHFPLQQDMHLGDAPRPLGLRTLTGLPLTVTSSDHTVAIVANDSIYAVGGGVATIAVVQAGDEGHLPARVERLLRVIAFPAPEGRGTLADPYRIKDLAELNWLSATRSAWDKHFVQTADIVATGLVDREGGQGFPPIGRTGQPFTGTYHGQGHSISALFIQRDMAEGAGLFGVLQGGARIDSVRLLDVTIRSNSLACGGLAGTNDGGTIDGVRVTGVISCGGAAGGLVAFNRGGRLLRSSSWAVVHGGRHVGGVVGSNEGDVLFCYAAENDVVGRDHVGGLAGSNRCGETASPAIPNCATIRQSYADVPVRGDLGRIGGLVGFNDGSLIESSHSVGSVVGSGGAVGGLVGENRSGTIASSYWRTTTAVAKTGVGADSLGNIGFTGLSLAQMGLESSFPTWDFSRVWQILSGRAYPGFRNLSDGVLEAVAVKPHFSRSGNGAYPVAIYDLHGRQVWKGLVRRDGARWVLPRLGAGIWVVRARTEQGVISWRATSMR